MHISLLKTSKPWSLITASLLAIGCHGALYSQDTVFERSKLVVSGRVINIEVAHSDAQRATGLMFREKLPADDGMWFVFDEEREHCMWMKNTLIDLDVAFVSNKGKIINIENMKAETQTPHCAEGSALYALEMNSGWFANNGIGPGDQIKQAY